jgi:hypothetical protein
MQILELRDLDLARRFVLESLWLQRVVPPVPRQVKPALDWAFEVASAGQPLPPLGFIADLGHAAFGSERAAAGTDFPEIPGMPPGLARTYEDHVLGKLFADWTFERAGDALRRYQGRDRARGLAFVLQQFRERADFDGVHLSPGILKGLLDRNPDEVLAEGWDTLSRDGLLPLLPTMIESLVAAARRTAEVLAPEDIFELEHGTALAEMGERVALRQVLQAAARLEADLPRLRVRPQLRRREVPTRILDEDTYPVGGFSSIATRGSVESLLHSQLVYMEKVGRPDLFDIKFLRDELLYYARDENQFLRRRRTFVFALYPDLAHARFKDADIPWQRGVLLLGLLLVAVRKLTEWLSTDALRFEFVWVSDNETEGLAPERALLQTVLREPLANGTVGMTRVSSLQVAAFAAERARRSLCHCLLASAGRPNVAAEEVIVSRLQVNSSRLLVALPDEDYASPDADTAVECWSHALERLLEQWV